MPKTEVILFAEEDGTSPLLEWLDDNNQKRKTNALSGLSV